MQTIGIRIVYAQNESAVGHMYVVFKGADGTTQSFGHYPQSAIDSGGGRGEVRTTDIQRESSPFPPGTGGVPDVPRDFPVSPGDYQRALDYARDAVNQKGDITNKWGYYGPITRSCIDFTTNNFHSEFTDNPVVTASAALLPQMQGAGFVRDMREAMSLGTATAQTLEQTVNSFKSATTTQDRQALVDQVITAWASTSSLGDAKTRNPVSTALLSSGGASWDYQFSSCLRPNPLAKSSIQCTKTTCHARTTHRARPATSARPNRTTFANRGGHASGGRNSSNQTISAGLFVVACKQGCAGSGEREMIQLQNSKSYWFNRALGMNFRTRKKIQHTKNLVVSDPCLKISRRINFNTIISWKSY